MKSILGKGNGFWGAVGVFSVVPLIMLIAGLVTQKALPRNVSAEEITVSDNVNIITEESPPSLASSPNSYEFDVIEEGAGNESVLLEEKNTAPKNPPNAMEKPSRRLWIAGIVSFVFLTFIIIMAVKGKIINEEE